MRKYPCDVDETVSIRTDWPWINHNNEVEL
jgi:hypothetical protein